MTPATGSARRIDAKPSFAHTGYLIAGFANWASIVRLPETGSNRQRKIYLSEKYDVPKNHTNQEGESATAA
jgi:hypothetical protein